MQLKAFFLSFLIPLLAFGQNTEGSEIIQKTFSNLSNIHPEKALQSFEYKAYAKGIVQTQNQTTEALIDSGNNFIYEEISQFQFNHKKPLQKKIIGSHFPGFEAPFYPLFSETFHSPSVYEPIYEILGKKFHSPVSKNAQKHYRFKLKQTVQNTVHPYYIIHFSPLNKSSASQLEGTLYIDKQSYSVQKAVINYHGNMDMVITHQFRFHESENIWFPDITEIKIILVNAIEPFYLFRKNIPLGRLKFDESEETSTSFTYTITVFDVVINDSHTQSKSPLNITATLSENNIDDNFRSEYQITQLSENETAIVTSAGEYVSSSYIEKHIQRIEDFGLGFLELGFFDLDLKFLIKYNNYEGFRSGLGGVTNDRLSPHFNLGGYIVRGFKDEAFKYQLSTSFNINRASGTILDISYTDDVTEMGSNTFLTDRRTFSLFEPRLVNIIEFFKHESWETNLQHTINPKLNADVEFSHSNISQILNYEFLDEGTLFSNYQLTKAKVSLLWSPFGKFMQTPNGIIEYHTGYPRFSAQFTQSFKGLLDGNFNFSKIDVRANYFIKHLNRSNTEVVLEGNAGFGNIPLTHMYHSFPNSPNKETILNRFSVAGIKSFETMYFGEFFSDKLATVHIKHQLKPFMIAPWFKPELVLITRHAIGTVSNLENHQNISFNTMEKGYSESGLEINQLFYGFGVSMAFRYGAYQLPQFEDNISFKFTFYLKL